MRVKNPFITIDESLNREFRLLHEISLSRRLVIFISRVFRSTRIGKWVNLFDDKTDLLEDAPLGMYIYNLRFIFMSSAMLYLTVLYFVSLATRVDSKTQELIADTLSVLGCTLTTAVLLTLLLHKRFLRNLRLQKESRFATLHKVFQPYFLIDFVLILVAFLIGKYYLDLSLSSVLLLLASNIYIYSTYMIGETLEQNRETRILWDLLIPFGVLVLIIFLLVSSLPGDRLEDYPLVFGQIMFWTPVLASGWVALISSAVISYLRRVELEKSKEILNFVKDLLSMYVESEETSFLRVGLENFLKKICQANNLYPYSAARISIIDYPNDLGNPEDSDPLSKRLFETAKFGEFSLGQDEIPLDPSLLADMRSGATEKKGRIVVPISSRGDLIGALEVQRKSTRYLRDQESAYLSTVAEFLYSAIVFLSLRERIRALDMVDGILSIPQNDNPNLGAVYEKTIQVLQMFLDSKGIMLLLRTENDKLEIVAKHEISDQVYKNSYTLSRGLTGKSARTGQIIRVNSISDNLALFDDEWFANLQESIGEEIYAWMAIPIGTEDENLGVVKVVNKLPNTGRAFTSFDKDLASNLARKLKVVLDQAIQYGDIVVARDKERQAAILATEERMRAESLASQREEDILTLSHTLQAPLAMGTSKIEYLLEEGRLRTYLVRQLEYIRDTLKDSLQILFGILVISAMDTDNKPALIETEVKLSKEARDIIERVRKTNKRRDLKIGYEESPGFPVIKISNRILGTVLYTLVHNAMKYSDRGSIVQIECGFEYRGSNTIPALKVKTFGPPIDVSEKELIFDQFYRGRSVKNTGVFGLSGTGLGLYVARKLMRSIEGDIVLEKSQSNERLSVFVVLFPRQADPIVSV